MRLVWICKPQDDHDVCWTRTQVSVLAWPSLESRLETYCNGTLVQKDCSEPQYFMPYSPNNVQAFWTDQPSRKETRCLSDADEIYIVSLVLANPSMYLQELCQKIHHVTLVTQAAPFLKFPQKTWKHFVLLQWHGNTFVTFQRFHINTIATW